MQQAESFYARFNIYEIHKMSSSLSSIKIIVDTIANKRLILKKNYTLRFLGKINTRFELRYILRCVGMTSHKNTNQLIQQIIQHGIKIGDIVVDPIALGPSITIEGLDSCPMYLLKSYLKRNNLSIDGDKKELVKKIKECLESYHEKSIISQIDDIGKIQTTCQFVVEGKSFGEDEIDLIDMMEDHGFRYDKCSKTFFNIETGAELLSGKMCSSDNKYINSLTYVKNCIELVETTKTNMKSWAHKYALRGIFDLPEIQIASRENNIMLPILPIGLNKIRELAVSIVDLSVTVNKNEIDLSNELIEEINFLHEKIKQIKKNIDHNLQA